MNVHHQAARLAVVRLGTVKSDDALSNAEVDRRTALEIAACDPRRASDAGLLSLVSSDPEGAELAWGILASRQPRATFARLGTVPVSADIRWRVVALTGYLDGVIVACAAMSESSDAVSASQRDVLELALGGVPAQVRVEPGDPSARSIALRSLLLKALRRAHVRLHNDADRSDWRIESIVVDPAQASTVRLRHGTTAPLCSTRYLHLAGPLSTSRMPCGSGCIRTRRHVGTEPVAVGDGCLSATGAGADGGRGGR